MNLNWVPILLVHLLQGPYRLKNQLSSTIFNFSTFSAHITQSTNISKLQERLRFLSQIISIFYLIVFSQVLNSTHFHYLFHSTNCKTAYEMEKLFKTWCHLERLRVLWFWKKNFISVPISPKMTNIAGLYLQNFFGDIRPPCC